MQKARGMDAAGPRKKRSVCRHAKGGGKGTWDRAEKCLPRNLFIMKCGKPLPKEEKKPLPKKEKKTLRTWEILTGKLETPTKHFVIIVVFQGENENGALRK